jgi:predicted TPR repeat methyltransferase
MIGQPERREQRRGGAMQDPAGAEAGEATGESLLTIEEALEVAVRAHRSGDLSLAEDLYRRILAAAPDCAPALHFLGLVLHQTERSAEGIDLIRRAIAHAPDDAGMHNNLGNVLSQRARYDEAAEAYRAAIAIAPGHADALSNRGAALRQLGRRDEAETCYRQAIEADPRHREAHDNLGRLLSASGRIDEAIACLTRALELQPRNAESRRVLAAAYAALGEQEKASAILRDWLADEPFSPTARHLLAAVSGQNVPERADDTYVRTTFDGFAASFDSKLAKLGYRAPALVAGAVEAALGPPASSMAVLDAGCGTGLCGPLLRPYAAHLAGVDLSSKMLDGASTRAVYDELVCEELTAFLRRRPATYDLVASADTLCYFGPLEAVLQAAASALRPGGLLAFTVEEEESGDDVRLNPHGRYSHQSGYVARVLGSAGLVGASLAREALRQERGADVRGLVVTARKPDGAGARPTPIIPG